jgi:MtN3 and saliva related transmembrane protein
MQLRGLRRSSGARRGLTSDTLAVQRPGRYGALCGVEIQRGQQVQVGATAIGMLAAILTTLAFVPQVVKTWRSHSTHDISLGTFTLLVVGVATWLVYGALIGDVPLILANGVTLLLAGTILVLKIRNG